jgi:hypothetical protein
MLGATILSSIDAPQVLNRATLRGSVSRRWRRFASWDGRVEQFDDDDL